MKTGDIKEGLFLLELLDSHDYIDLSELSRAKVLKQLFEYKYLYVAEGCTINNRPVYIERSLLFKYNNKLYTPLGFYKRKPLE